MSNGPAPAPQVPQKARCPSDAPEVPDPGEQAARLQAEQELRDALAEDGFAGPAYAVFEEDLVNFGYNTMEALLRSGYIFARCREAGLHLRPGRSMPVTVKISLRRPSQGPCDHSRLTAWRAEGGSPNVEPACEPTSPARFCTSSPTSGEADSAAHRTRRTFRWTTSHATPRHPPRASRYIGDV